MKALEIKNLKKSYGKNQALKGISFDIEQGEMFALLGPNGSGKSTLINILATLLRQDSGEANIFGYTVAPENLESKRLIGVVPQEIVNHGFFNVEEVLGFISGYYGIWNNKERIAYLLNKLGLWEHRKKLVRELSGGMKRRLLIAKALVHSPKLLLLDEPTAGVDIELRNSLWDFIRELNREENIAILLTTHYLEEAEELCDRVGILSLGNLLEIGNTKDLIKKLTQRELTLVINDPNYICNSAYLVRQEANELHFSVPSDKNIGSILLELNLDIKMLEDIRLEEGSLEDAFINVLKREVK